MRRENLFSLLQPELYDCFVERYHSNLQVLRLRAQRIESAPPAPVNTIEMVFSAVLYFRGVFNWTGANVCVADLDAYVQLLYAVHLLDDTTPDEDIEETLEHYCLYVIPTSTGNMVQFVAHCKDYTSTVMG